LQAFRERSEWRAFFATQTPDRDKANAALKAGAFAVGNW